MVPIRVAILVVLGVSAAAAQTPFSSGLTGTVRDATSGVLAGAAVSITAPTLIGGAQTATTDARGEYRFALLPPGTYEIAVAARAFRPARRTGVQVAAGATMTIDFALEVAGPTNEVVIRGSSPVVDVKSAAVPVRLDEKLLQNLPTSRSIADIINLAPGVAADVAFGGSQRGNEILLDGVRTTTPILQDPVVRANYNWVQEMNIVSLGAPAASTGRRRTTTSGSATGATTPTGCSGRTRGSPPPTAR
ncbi:MAG: carboxypeptidase regulatory-like domain-containing protein [Acidobacteriota bacterium]